MGTAVSVETVPGVKMQRLKIKVKIMAKFDNESFSCGDGR